MRRDQQPSRRVATGKLGRRVLVNATCSFPLLLLAFLSQATFAEETVTIRPERPGGKPYALRGEVLDETGRELILRVQGTTRERRIPIERVERVDTEWPATFTPGKTAFAKGDFAAAADHFVAANREEKRSWARRRILAELMLAYRGLGRDGQAGDLFLAIVGSDPTTPSLERIPLAWFATESVSKSKAKDWLARTDVPAATLLGASYLLATDERATALTTLRQLTDRATDPRIAALAEAQRWRSVVNASESDVARWHKRIHSMPTPIRGGPYFVLAQAYERLDLPNAAALAYLRVPIHFTHDRPLAARALLGAARTTLRTGHTEEAQRLLRELIREHPKRPEQTEAERILKTIDSSERPGD